MRRTDALWLGMLLMALAVLGGLEGGACPSRTVTVAEPFELRWVQRRPAGRLDLKVRGDGLVVGYEAGLLAPGRPVRVERGRLTPREAAEILQAVDTGSTWAAPGVSGPVEVSLEGRGRLRRAVLGLRDPAALAVAGHPAVKGIEERLAGQP